MRIQVTAKNVGILFGDTMYIVGAYLLHQSLYTWVDAWQDTSTYVHVHTNCIHECLANSTLLCPSVCLSRTY